MRDALDILRQVEKPIVGGDIVKYNPHRDREGVTAALALKLLKELAFRMLIGAA